MRLRKPHGSAARRPADRARRLRRSISAALPVVVLSLAGCAGRGPDLFPAAPLSTQALSGGGERRLYDLDRDGRGDYAEELCADGVVARLWLDPSDAAGAIDLVALRAANGAGLRHLVIILDSTPFELVRELWDQGRLRAFRPPVRVIAPFPAMTDLCLSEFFGVSPTPGIESKHYDGVRLTSGLSSYLNEVNAPWHAGVDYRLTPLYHGFSYLSPQEWLDHELGRIQRRFEQSAEPGYVGYVVSTSGLGAQQGRDGHVTALIRIDRMCQRLVRQTRGRTHITLFSDHGHDLRPSRRIPLAERLRLMGYAAGERLDAADAVLVPEFGTVSCAAIHTRAAARVARDALEIEGVEVSAFVDVSGRVIVLSRGGEAAIERTDAGYRYTRRRGDPLQLSALLARGAAAPSADGWARGSDGVFEIDDHASFDATVEHVYPDPLHRLWRAFHGLVRHTPDVLLSLAPGYHCGSESISEALELAAAHGCLRREGTTGFALTTAGELPPAMRTEDLRAALMSLGVPLPVRGRALPP